MTKITLVELFLPSYAGTKIIFLRSIVADQKKVFRQDQITHIVVPKYEELSVKNLYLQALADPMIGSYLPDQN